ncbi:MAG: preprotein translocase subunit SecY [Candidatus Diapherotrites archaeon]
MSFIDMLDPLYGLLPEVKSPEVKPVLNKRLLWTGIALVLYFVLGNIMVVGVSEASKAQLGVFEFILASNIGTLLTVGIGPIVLASIILQLLVGAKIIDIDMSDPAQKSKFTSLQKLFAIVLCLVEAVVYSMSGFLFPAEGMFWIVVAQIAIGAIILLYLDEVVSKYGIGSGIGLFIAANVSHMVFWRIFNPFGADVLAGGTGALTLGFDVAQGFLFLFIRELSTTGLFQASVNYMFPILAAVVVFMVVVFAEGIHVNIPITMGRRGTGGRFPVKFLYVSNIPVILAIALFANVQLMAQVVTNAKIPYLDVALNIISQFVTPPSQLLQTIFLEGIPATIFNDVLATIVTLNVSGSVGSMVVQAFVYLIILTIACIIFGKFWVDMAGQGPSNVAEQLQNAGMSIPGFRRDPRIIQKVLERYIPPITIMGSAFVGLLAGFADLTGALGSGTGILLTVGIIYRLYEELAKMQLMEMHPLLGKLLG